MQTSLIPPDPEQATTPGSLGPDIGPAPVPALPDQLPAPAPAPEVPPRDPRLPWYHEIKKTAADTVAAARIAYTALNRPIHLAQGKGDLYYIWEDP